MLRFFTNVLRDLLGIGWEGHTFEPAISLRTDDGRLAVLECTKCGYCTYADIPSKDDPPCVPRTHKWEPIKVFQWDDLSIVNKNHQAYQCALCGKPALTRDDLTRLGCPGHRSKDADHRRIHEVRNRTDHSATT